MSMASASRSTCTTPSSSSWSRPAPELLGPAGVERPGGGEDLGREAGDRRERHRRRTGGVDGVAELQPGGVDQPDDVAGEGLLDRRPIRPEGRRGVLRGQVAAGAVARHAHAALEVAGADAGEGQSVAVRRIHVGLHLEHERRERCGERALARRRRRARGDGDGARSITASSSSRTPKLVSADPTNTGVDSPARNEGRSTSAPTASSSAQLVDGVLPRRALLGGGDVGRHDELGRQRRAAVGAGEAHVVAACGGR